MNSEERGVYPPVAPLLLHQFVLPRGLSPSRTKKQACFSTSRSYDQEPPGYTVAFWSVHPQTRGLTHFAGEWDCAAAYPQYWGARAAPSIPVVTLWDVPSGIPARPRIGFSVGNSVARVRRPRPNANRSLGWRASGSAAGAGTPLPPKGALSPNRPTRTG